MTETTKFTSSNGYTIHINKEGELLYSPPHSKFSNIIQPAGIKALREFFQQESQEPDTPDSQSL